MKIGNREFDFENSCYIMGILNVTPDSFSDGGKWNEVDAALYHVEEMINEGSDIIDIGGESTRPGHEQVSSEEEAGRVVPVIRAIKKRFDVPVSLDTYKTDVAVAGINAGADMINDIWGLRYPEPQSDMGKLISDANVPCVLMHNRTNTEYEDYPAQVFDELEDTIAVARNAGIKDEKIILDPGIGFGKTLDQNLALMNHLAQMNDLGFPWLLGTSRKSMIGLTLELPTDERLEGTLATSVIGAMNGAGIIRVHDIRENFRAIKMTMAILHS